MPLNNETKPINRMMLRINKLQYCFFTEILEKKRKEESLKLET